MMFNEYLSAEPEERDGFGLFNFAEIRMVGGNKRAVQLDSGRQPNGVAQRNGVLCFQAGSLGENYLVNGVNKLNRHGINLFENKAGLLFAQCTVEQIIHFNQIDSVHVDNRLPRVSFIKQRADFIKALFFFEQGNEGAGVKNVSQLPSPLFFNLIVPPPLFEKAVHRNRGVLAERPNFFQRSVKAINRFFSGKPVDFTASGRSHRYFPRNIKIHPSVRRDFNRLRYRHNKVSIA